MAAINYLTLRSTIVYTAPGSAAPTGYINVVSTGGNTWTNNISINNGGFSTLTGSTIGIGSTTPGYSLDVAGIVQGQTAFQSNTNANNVGLGPLQQIYLGQYGAAAPRGTCVRWGDSVGAAYYVTTGGTNLSFYKDVSGGNAALAFQLVGTSLTNATPNVYIPNSLGIGTASPIASLDVSGTIRMGTGTNIGLGGGGAKFALYADSNGQNPMGIQSYSDTNYIIFFWNAAGSYRGSILGVNSSSVAFNTSSDQRLKGNVQDMPSMISKIKQLKPRTYTWKASGDKDDGFVAQEVHKVFPQLMTSAVAYCDICHHSYSDLYDGKLCGCCDFENPIDKEGNPHYYGLDYGKFTPYLTKALQETIEIVETQNEKITTQSQQIADLQAQMTSLLSRLATAGI